MVWMLNLREEENQLKPKPRVLEMEYYQLFRLPLPNTKNLCIYTYPLSFLVCEITVWLTDGQTNNVTYVGLHNLTRRNTK